MFLLRDMPMRDLANILTSWWLRCSPSYRGGLRGGAVYVGAAYYDLRLDLVHIYGCHIDSGDDYSGIWKKMS